MYDLVLKEGRCKELKGFIKVELKAGETKRVEIPFDDKTFRYFNTVTNKWEVEAGTYDIMIGASSDNIVLRGTLEHKGTGAPLPYDKRTLPNYAVGSLRNIPDAEFEALLGRPIPDGNLHFYKKNRMVVDYNTTVIELRYAKRWIGRLVGKAIPWFVRVLRKLGKRELANTLVMGVVYQPLRGWSRFSQGGLRMSQLDGLIMMFNGKFFKGLHHFFKEGRKYKKLAKAEKKALEAEKAQKETEEKEAAAAVNQEPVVEEQPKVEEPVVQEQVVEEAPVEEAAPEVDEQPVEEVPAEETQAEEQPVEEQAEEVVEEPQPEEEIIEEPVEEEINPFEEIAKEIKDE